MKYLLLSLLFIGCSTGTPRANIEVIETDTIEDTLIETEGKETASEEVTDSSYSELWRCIICE
jgi:hypothetical protein